VGNELLQRRQFAIGIIQSVAAMSFAQMDLVLEAQRMAEMVNGVGFSPRNIARSLPARA
jgi:hypothetical protein